MDQKNTIVKCKAHPDCLFNYNGVCDNYVINISADGKCECYVETTSEEDMKNGVIGEYKTINATCGDCEYFGNIDNCPVYKRTHILFRTDPICLDFQFRGQRAKCNVYDDACDISFLKENLEKIQQTLEKDSIPCTIKVAELNKPNKNKSVIKSMSDHLCDTKCKYWQLDSYSEWVCGCMAEDFNPHGYCPHYDDGEEE